MSTKPRVSDQQLEVLTELSKRATPVTIPTIHRALYPDRENWQGTGMTLTSLVTRGLVAKTRYGGLQHYAITNAGLDVVYPPEVAR